MSRARGAALLCFVLAGCSFTGGPMEQWAPPGGDRYAREYLALVARGQVDSAELKLAAEVPHDSARFYLRILGDSLAGTPLDSAPMVGVQTHTSTVEGVERTSSKLTYLVPMRGKWMMVSISMVDAAGLRQLTGFAYHVLAQDPRVQAAFTLRDKPAAQYLWLLMAIAAGATAFGTAFWVARQRGFPRRWLWALVALVGAGTSTLDWGSGAMSYQMFNALIFSFGAIRAGPAGAWEFSFAFPAGAFVALTRYRAWKAKQAALVAEAPPAGVSHGPEGPEPPLTPRS